MKQRILMLLTVGVFALITGCTSAPQKHTVSYDTKSTQEDATRYNDSDDSSETASADSEAQGDNARGAIADQRLAMSEFKKDGVKIIYDLKGRIVAIEVTGYAATWGGSHNAGREAYRIAELEAKKSLNDFIHKETIISKTSVVMISENLEHAQDNVDNKLSTSKKSKNNEEKSVDELVATDDDARNRIENEQVDDQSQTLRNNAARIANRLRTTIIASNRGIISGLYYKEGGIIDGGKAVKVVMRWDKKHNSSRLEIGRMMNM